MSEIEEKVLKILCSTGEPGLSLNTPFRETSLDSLDMVEVTMDLELEFEIDIEDDDVLEWKNGWDCVRCVQQKLMC